MVAIALTIMFMKTRHIADAWRTGMEIIETKKKSKFKNREDMCI